MVVREIIVDYTAPGLSDALSVFYFAEADPVTPQRSAIDQLFTDFGNVLANDLSWSVRTAGREVDQTSGGLTGEWTDAVPANGTGGGSSTELANATSLLLRWNTGAIVDGRFVRGRTYVPGAATTACADGQVASAAVLTISTALNTFVSAAVGFGIWHRPTSGAGGSFHPVSSATVWSEFAVQRRRR